MAYTYKYRMNSQPTPSTDGSGVVMHDIEALSSPDATVWTPVPGKHKTICIPAAILSAALASGTNAAKTAAYKNALAANINTVPVPISGWAKADLDLQMVANDAALAAANAANTFITVTLNQVFPVVFAF